MRVDIEQPLPILGCAGQPFKFGKQDIPRRIVGQRLAQHGEGARWLLQPGLTQPGHFYGHLHLRERVRRARTLARIHLDEVLPQSVGFGGRFQASQRLLVGLLDVGPSEELEGPARFVEHGFRRLGHVEEQPAPFCDVLSVPQEFLRDGDERLSVIRVGVKWRQGGQCIRLLGLDLDHPFEGPDGSLGILQAVAIQASDFQRTRDSFPGIRGEAQLPFRHARHARPIVTSLGHPAQGLVCLHAGGVEIGDDVFQYADRLGRIIQLLNQQAGMLEREGNRLGRIGGNGDTASQEVSQRRPIGLRRRDG